MYDGSNIAGCPYLYHLQGASMACIGYLLVGISGEILMEFCRIPQILEFKKAELS
jgi:hypothetical protein